MTREDRLYQEKMKKLIEADMLYNEVYALYSELATEANDYIVREYFDPDSMKNLRKKKRVLQELLKGKSYKEVGKDVVDILEKLPPEFLSGKVDVEVMGLKLSMKDFN